MEKSLYEFLQAILHTEYEFLHEFTMEFKIEPQKKCLKEFVLECWKKYTCMDSSANLWTIFWWKFQKSPWKNLQKTLKQFHYKCFKKFLKCFLKESLEDFLDESLEKFPKESIEDFLMELVLKFLIKSLKQISKIIYGEMYGTVLEISYKRTP